MLSLSDEKLDYIVEKAREFDAEVEPEAEDEASDAVDDRAGMTAALQDTGDNPAEQELAAALAALNDDERTEILALMWIGRGDFDASEWQDALEQARQTHDQRETRYLLGTPLLADYLEQGRAELEDSDAAE
jgi:hypothetical protein